MKIKQQDTLFQPVVITLESPEEVKDLWDIILKASFHWNDPIMSPSSRKLAEKISNYFSHEAVL